jgi:hypothetical protein
MLASAPPFCPELWDWNDDPDGQLFLDLTDALTDRIAAVLDDYDLSYHQIASGEAVYLRADAPKEARNAVRAAMTLARCSAFAGELILGSDAVTAGLLRRAFAEFFVAGLLHHSVNPDLLGAIKELGRARTDHERRHARASLNGMRSGQARKQRSELDWAPVKLAFLELREKHPQETNRRQIEAMIRAGYGDLQLGAEMPKGEKSSLYRKIEDWMR